MVNNKLRLAIDKAVKEATPKKYHNSSPGFCIDCGTDEMFSFYNCRCRGCHEEIWHQKLRELNEK